MHETNSAPRLNTLVMQVTTYINCQQHPKNTTAQATYTLYVYSKRPTIKHQYGT